MSTVTVIEEWIKTSDGHEIFTKTWKPVGETVAQVVLVHGFGEHIGRYDRLCRAFGEHGILSYGFDQRGFGQTGKRAQDYGNNHGYNTALSDINSAILRVKKNAPALPLILMGHSMGGGLILNLLARREKYEGVKSVRAAIASAPLVTLSMPVSPFRYYPLMIASKIIPSFVIQIGLNPAGISTDPAEVEIYKADPLIHDYSTLASVNGFLDAGKDLLDLAPKITTPVLYSHGDADPINDCKGTQQVFKLSNNPKSEMKVWPGLFHELHQEKPAAREQVTQCYIEWIKSHLGEPQE
ncbi:Alpha/Beta hydrolase protein [Dichotomocladium elegans]|nr:Alpha/Beta hydrolase protein [Dichotomocladium elegans]